MSGFLIALASGTEAFAIAQICVSHPLGQIALFGYSLALFYHACNGIRHLFWDAVIGLSIIMALCLTVALWSIIYFVV